MMLEIWNYSDHDIASSSEESFDSDKVDSEVEAELYSAVHHQEVVASPNNSVNPDANINAESKEKLDTQQNSFTKDTSLSKNDQCSNSSSSFMNNSTENCVEICVPKAHSTPKFNTGCLSTKRKPDLLLENSSNVSESTQSNTTSNKKQKTLYQSKVKELHKKFENGNHTSEFDDSVICEPDYSSKDKNSNDVNKVVVQDEEQFCDEYVILESSDSDDSIIWSEPGEQSRDLKTNVLGDTVTLSSDSSSDSSDMLELRHHTSNKAESRNMSMPNIKLLGNSTDPWHINAEDLFRSKKRYSGRYHERAALNCSTCKQKGHTSKSCTIQKAVKCFICGDNHNGGRCQKRMCGKCYNLGHDSRWCWMQGVNLCVICGMDGHSETVCPDKWRRFHLTTKPTGLIEGKQLIQDTPIYCFNCGHQGHFGAECMEPRMCSYSSSFPTWPSVVYYRDPNEIYQNLKENISTEQPQVQNLSQKEMERMKKRKKNQKRKKKQMLKQQKEENAKLNYAIKKAVESKERNMEKSCKKYCTNNAMKLKKKKVSENNGNFRMTVNIQNPVNFGSYKYSEEINFPRTQKQNPAFSDTCPELNQIKNIWKFKRQRRKNKKKLGKVQNCNK